ncbi:MAG: NUDIX hydrolase [Parcubacteria group bacterium GW2011_GWC2_39_14]|nr:MAG: NUDIX hydrolase [Parcubacteria group bacterium GW2011_GWC2_39_14]
MIKYIQIGLIVLKVDIKKGSQVINDILRFFKVVLVKKSDGVIVFKAGAKRSIKIDLKNRSVEVAGPTLDDRVDPLLPIMIMQVIFRFADLIAIDKPQLLLHASTAVWSEGKTILFGDDGTNVGKTTASLELSLKSKGYVSDEFSIYNVASNTVLDFPDLPIHIRNEYLTNLNSRGILVDDTSRCHGLFSLSDFGLKSNSGAQLSMIVYPRYCLKAKPKVICLSKTKSKANLEILVFSHRAKFLYPKYDRASWLKKTDCTEIFDMKNDCRRLAYGKNDFADQVLQKVASYSITFQTPSQIVGLVARAVRMEQKRSVKHLSASAVVYFKNKEDIKILLIKKADGSIFLPKGHVNYGEKASDAALREAKEETGLISGIVKRKIGEYSYIFTPNYGFATHNKTVSTYLIEGKKIKLKALATEGFVDAFLVPPEEAIKRCSFEDEKKMIAKAFKQINYV